MTLGADPKKVKILVGLLVAAVAVYFINSSPSGETSSPSKRSPSTAGSNKTPAQGAPADSGTPRRAKSEEREFRPSVKPKRGEARPDPTTIDPTLRLDLLAKLQQVNVDGVHRSIFDFGQPPPSPEAVKLALAASKVKPPNPLTPPAKPATPVVAVAEPPKAPPIPFKFYGYTSPSNQPNKRAFFMEGDDIHVVREGEVVKSRYKIVRIGVNSVVVEDLQFKSQQTLPLEEQSS